MHARKKEMFRDYSSDRGMRQHQLQLRGAYFRSNRWRQYISGSASFRSSRLDRMLSESIRSMSSSRRSMYITKITIIMPCALSHFAGIWAALKLRLDAGEKWSDSKVWGMKKLPKNRKEFYEASHPTKHKDYHGNVDCMLRFQTSKGEHSDYKVL